MRLLFKQQSLFWSDSYDICDGEGRTAYTVKGKLSREHRPETCGPAGDRLGTIREEVLALLPRFTLYAGEEYLGCTHKEFALFRPRLALDCSSWEVEGGFLERDYAVTNPTGHTVMAASKELPHWTNTYVLDIVRPEDALLCLMIILTIGAAKCSAGNGRTGRRRNLARLNPSLRGIVAVPHRESGYAAMLESAATHALLLSLAAGLSALLGAPVVFAVQRRSKKLLAVPLDSAGGMMLAVSFTDLFPTTREHLTASLDGRPGALAAVLFLTAGIGCATALDHLVPHDAFGAGTGEAPYKNLFRVDSMSTPAMALRNFPEGVTTFLTGYEDPTLGVSITLAIALHNIPEGISMTIPVWYTIRNRRRTFCCTLFSGLTGPVGAVLALALLRPFLNGLLLGVLSSAVAGIMVYIAVEKFIPSSRQYSHDRPVLWATLCGICMVPLTHLFQT